MKELSQLTEIGQFCKPHGIHGELSAELSIPTSELPSIPCIFVDFDGLMVPFFIGSIRPKGAETVLISLDDVTDEVKAATFARKKIYAEKKWVSETDEDDDIIYLQDMAGYTLYDGPARVGTISDIDDSTENVLFVIERDNGSSILIPATEELIESIDTESKTIVMSLPIGLTNL